MADEQARFIAPSENGVGTKSVFLVHAIIGDLRYEPWVVVTRPHSYEEKSDEDEQSEVLDLEDESSDGSSTDGEGLGGTIYYQCKPAEHGIVQYLLLSTSLRKCFGVHACHKDNNCHTDVCRKTIVHKVASDQTSTFMILTRADGYPPRRA